MLKNFNCTFAEDGSSFTCKKKKVDTLDTLDTVEGFKTDGKIEYFEYKPTEKNIENFSCDWDGNDGCDFPFYRTRRGSNPRCRRCD